MFNKVFWGAVDDEQRGRWLVAIFKGVGVLGL